MKKLILVDLDGVLNEYTGKFDNKFIPNMRGGADKFLKSLSTVFTVKIFTTRDHNLAQKWLDDNNLSRYIAGITNIKEPAFLIIDDRCINFQGDYSQTLEQIKDFNVWYSK